MKKYRSKEEKMKKKSQIGNIYFFILLVSAVFNLSAVTFTGVGYKTADGDSILVVFNRKAITVELAGVDCPELEQEFGKEAAAFTNSFIYRKKVTVDVLNYDEEEHIIGKVTVDEKDLALSLIEAGLAWYIGGTGSDRELSRAQKTTKKAKKGLWIQSKPIPPWTFRKNRDKLKEAN